MGNSKLKEVVMVTMDEKALSYQLDENANLINQIQVISQEYEFPALQDEINFIGRKENQEQVFVKNPFRNQYIDINQAEEKIFKSKIGFYKRIAKLLGAKSFAAKAEFVDEKKQTMDGDLNVGVKGVKIDIDVQKDTNEKINKTYELESDFLIKDNFDRHRAYQSAKNLVQRYNLHGEIEIIDLIENNNPDEQSREVRQRVKLQLTNELNDLLEISFKLTAMKGVFGLGANFKSTTESVKTIILDTEITF